MYHRVYYVYGVYGYVMAYGVPTAQAVGDGVARARESCDATTHRR